MAKTSVILKLKSGESCFVSYLKRQTQGTKRETILLIHGLSSSSGPLDATLSKSLIEKAESLNMAIAVYSLDLPGHGDSEKNLKHFSTDLIAEVIDKFIEKLKLGRVHVYGISLGGSGSIKFAANHPDKIKDLTVQGPPIRGADWGNLRLLYSPALGSRHLLKIFKLNGSNPLTKLSPDKISAIVHGLTDMDSIRRSFEATEDMKDLIIKSLKKVSMVAAMDYVYDIFHLDLAGDLEYIRDTGIPLFVIDGAKPEHAGVDTLDRIHNIVPKSRTLKIEGEGHLVTVLAHEAISEEYLDFIKTAH